VTGPGGRLVIALALGALVAGGPVAAAPKRRTAVVEAVERASPAVVNISTEQVVERRGGPFRFPADPFFDEFFNDFLDPLPERSRRTSLGSGVLVDSGGTILTNAHVILRGSRVQVTLSDGRDFEAALVGADADSDLAVLRIEGGGRLPYMEMGTTDDLMIGETVIAIGNPFGLSHTVTTGVVSAAGRSLRSEERIFSDFIQTDASINPGNSGGPLLNIRGELIGINTAIYGKAQGIGFAIPVERARRVMRDLVSFGSVREGWLGVAVQDLTRDLALHFGVRQGVVIADVEAHSPAARAGVQRGMILTHIDGRPIRTRQDFEQILDSLGPGDRLTLTLRDEERTRDLPVTIRAVSDEALDDFSWDGLGIATEEADDGLRIARVRPGSPAARIGIEPGDRLLGVAGKRLATSAELRRALQPLRRARGVIVTIGRGRYAYSVTLPLDR
jgi:serine protease Do